jgi:hypothetical protein
MGRHFTFVRPADIPKISRDTDQEKTKGIVEGLGRTEGEGASNEPHEDPTRRMKRKKRRMKRRRRRRRRRRMRRRRRNKVRRRRVNEERQGRQAGKLRETRGKR